MTHRPKRSEVKAAAKEELVQGILEKIDRSYAPADPTGATSRLAEFFRALDDSTLREIAYRHGLFEEELAEDHEEHPEKSNA